jgi:ribonucleotide monophosphatase NagD (HAD superfamily)
MMITIVKIKAAGKPNDLMYQWAVNALQRHHMSFEESDLKNNVPNFILPKNKSVQ